MTKKHKFEMCSLIIKVSEKNPILFRRNDLDFIKNVQRNVLSKKEFIFDELRLEILHSKAVPFKSYVLL